MGYFSPRANLPRSGAQQNVRIRKFRLKSGFFSVSDDYNRRVLSKPLEFQANKYLCLSREDFSLHLLDDWGMRAKTLRVRTPANFRSLYFHLCTEKALSGRPKYYKKLLAHYNKENGFEVMSYENFQKAAVVMRQLVLMVGKVATNTIAAMSGSIPPFFPQASAIAGAGVVSRHVLGCRPDYFDIHLITQAQYAELFQLHDAAISTEDYWRLRKFEYTQLFSNITEEEKALH